MLYFCTLYNRDYTIGSNKSFTGMEPSLSEPLAQLTVSGNSLREAAARAYIRCVGRSRAKAMRRQQLAPPAILALQTCTRAIAASLRRTVGRLGEGYELDHVEQSWFIQVVPVPGTVPTKPRRLRLPTSRLLCLSRIPLPN